MSNLYLPEAHRLLLKRRREIRSWGQLIESNNPFDIDSERTRFLHIARFPGPFIGIATHLHPVIAQRMRDDPLMD